MRLVGGTDIGSLLHSSGPIASARAVHLISQIADAEGIQTYYRDRYGLKPTDFPTAERIWQGCLSLPIYAGLTDDEVDAICDELLTEGLDILAGLLGEL